MRTLAEDTSPEAERFLVNLLRRAPVPRKFQMIVAANQAARELALCGLRMQFPDDSPGRLRRRLAGRWLGTELADKAYGPITVDEPARD